MLIHWKVDTPLNYMQLCLKLTVQFPQKLLPHDEFRELLRGQTQYATYLSAFSVKCNLINYLYELPGATWCTQSWSSRYKSEPQSHALVAVAPKTKRKQNERKKISNCLITILWRLSSFNYKWQIDLLCWISMKQKWQEGPTDTVEWYNIKM